MLGPGIGVGLGFCFRLHGCTENRLRERVIQEANHKKSYTGNKHMGGCQNNGPFLGPYYNTAPNI